MLETTQLSTMIYGEILACCLCVIGVLFYRVFRDRDAEEQSLLIYFLSSVAFLFVSDFFCVIVDWFNAPDLAKYAAYFCYYLALNVAGFCWMRYSDSRCSAEKTKSIGYRIMIVMPMIICLVLLFTNYWTGWTFRIKDGAFEQGDLWYLQYIFSYMYMVFAGLDALVYAVRAKEKGDRRRGLTLASFLLGPVVGSAVQFFYVETPSLCVGTFVSTVSVYLTLQARDRRLREELQEEKMRQEALLNCMNTDFISISLIDLDTDTSIIYKLDKEMEDLIPNHENLGGYEAHIKEFSKRFVVAEDRAIYEAGMRLEHVLEELEFNPVYFVNYRVEIDKNIYYYQTKVVRAKMLGKPNVLAIGLHSVDEQVRREQEYRHRLEHDVKKRTMELTVQNEKLNAISEEIVELLGNVVEARDMESGKHIHRVKLFTRILIETVRAKYPEYRITKDEAETIISASAMHDLGKILIPDAILLKPGKLTPEEFEVMKTHSEKGCQILDEAPKSWNPEYLKYSREICRWHHEKYDGKGYPDGLVGDQIPISAQIVSIADCFEALISPRRYKPPYDPELAYNMIMNGECGEFSDKMKECLRICHDRLMETAYAEKDKYEE